MSRLAVRWIAGGAIALGVLGLLGTLLFHGGNLRGWLDGHYTKVSEDGTSRVYTAAGSPRKVADDIARRWKPVDRATDPAGYFLRYGEDYVAVTADGAGQSKVYLDDRNRGYARWYPYIGGTWGSFSGASGGGFRGGGPGAGK